MKCFREAEQKIEDNPMTRQDGDETLWSYDEATGLLLSKTYPDLHQELYGYDTMNRLTSKTQARQVDDRGTPLTTTYVYDEPSGRLLQVNHNDGTASTQYAYDHLGALTQASSSALDYQFAYDAQGRLSTQSSQGLGAHQLHYRYDALNRLNSYALNYGGAQVLDSQLGYDVWGRLSEVRLNGAAQAFAYHYDAQGGYLKSMSYPHGLQKDITLEAQRDLPVAIIYKKATDASFKWGNEYQFDALGRPINKKDYLNATQANLIHHYTHNDRHELVSDAMSDGRVCAYDYDNIGNRKNAQEGNDFHCTYQTNELNQYVQGTQADGATFAPQYDADGNQTLILSDTGVWQVRYNALNQAVCFTRQADASQAGTEVSVRIECEYDHMGRRVAKKVFEGGSMVTSKRYLYAGYLQIAELDAMVVAADEQANPVLRKTYLWDPMHAKATRLLAMSRFDASGAKVEDLYYAQDMLKNTITVLDAQGASRALYQYDPYGRVIKMQGDLARENPFRHSCEYADDETGLVYYNYRYYNTQDGRWINRDPIAEQGGVNLYGYVGNGVSWFWDMLGLAADNPDVNRKFSEYYDTYGEALKGAIVALSEATNIEKKQRQDAEIEKLEKMLKDDITKEVAGSSSQKTMKNYKINADQLYNYAYKLVNEEDVPKNNKSKILRDMMGVKWEKDIDSNIKKLYFKVASITGKYHGEKKKIANLKLNEHGVRICSKRCKNIKKYYFTEVVTGLEYSFPLVGYRPCRKGDKTEAMIHSHPNGDGPSVQDLNLRWLNVLGFNYSMKMYVVSFRFRDTSKRTIYKYK